jgi:hypothetical protein
MNAGVPAAHRDRQTTGYLIPAAEHAVPSIASRCSIVVVQLAEFLGPRRDRV